TIALIALDRRWYGGWSFGPRDFTEIQGPILILLGAAFESFGRRIGIIAACLFLILLYSIFIQFMGTFSDSTRNCDALPVNIDEQPSRLWDWSDHPIVRGIRADFK